jgi:hypothetical protein
MSCVSPPCPVDRLSQVIIDCNKSWEGGLTPGWHLTNYAKRKLITVAGSAGGAATDYPIKLTVHYGAGFDAGSDVYLSGLCRSDFRDLRFVKPDGTLLDYWIESYVASSYAIVWVEFDSIPIAPGTATFYLYYSYPSAGAVSSGANTFQFFDDFPGAVIDPLKWTAGTTGTGSITVGAGLCTLDSGAAGCARINRVCAPPCVIETRAQVSSAYDANNKDRIRLNKAGVPFDVGIFDDGGHPAIQVFWNGVYTGTLVPLDVNLRFKSFYTAALMTWNIETEAGAVVYTNNNAPGDPTEHQYEIGDWGGANQGKFLIDWVTVRPYVSPEPTISAWGAEESYQIYYGITNLKELAAGMTKGDLFVHNGTILARISPGAIGTNLMSHDFGFMLTWEFPP